MNDSFGFGRLIPAEDVWQVKKLAERDLVGVGSKVLFEFQDSSGSYVFSLTCERSSSEFFCKPCDTPFEPETGKECPFCGKEMVRR